MAGDVDGQGHWRARQIASEAGRPPCQTTSLSHRSGLNRAAIKRDLRLSKPSNNSGSFAIFAAIRPVRSSGVFGPWLYSQRYLKYVVRSEYRQVPK